MTEDVNIQDTVANKILNDKRLSKFLDTPAEAGPERELEADLARDHPASQIT